MSEMFEKMLVKALQMQTSHKWIVRNAGRILGILPVFYAEWIEKKDC